jgi:hypothetical protein
LFFSTNPSEEKRKGNRREKEKEGRGKKEEGNKKPERHPSHYDATHF